MRPNRKPADDIADALRYGKCMHAKLKEDGYFSKAYKESQEELIKVKEKLLRQCKITLATGILLPIATSLLLWWSF